MYYPGGVKRHSTRDARIEGMTQTAIQREQERYAVHRLNELRWDSKVPRMYSERLTFSILPIDVRFKSCPRCKMGDMVVPIFVEPYCIQCGYVHWGLKSTLAPLGKGKHRGRQRKVFENKSGQAHA